MKQSDVSEMRIASTALMQDALCISETSVDSNECAQRYNAEGCHLYHNSLAINSADTG
jgi:hypothetical protein